MSRTPLLEFTLPGGYPMELYSKLYHQAKSRLAVPTRWRLCYIYKVNGAIEIMGLPVYYASDTNMDKVILETNQGDFVEIIGTPED